MKLISMHTIVVFCAGSILSAAHAGDRTDINGDGTTDIGDIDELIGGIASGDNDPRYDFNTDGFVGHDDRDDWLSTAGIDILPTGMTFVLGDLNLDGGVDASDYIVWRRNDFNQTGAWSQGDFNADGNTDPNDFIIWNQNKFVDHGESTISNRETGIPASPGLAGDGVPDFFYGPDKGLLTVELDNSPLASLIIEGPDANNFGQSWQDGTATGEGGVFVTWIQRYFRDSEQWVVSFPVTQIVHTQQRYVIAQYETGLSEKDFFDVEVGLSEGQLFRTRVVIERAECIADLTGDGQLDFFDISAFLSLFSESNSTADFDGNGVFDFFDISAFLSAFSSGCP